jgi:hypothetical protein
MEGQQRVRISVGPECGFRPLMTGWMTPRAAPSFSCDDVAVTMVVGEGEPAAGPWRVERLTQFARFLVSAVGASLGRPAIVALDGRSSSGKTTLAHRLEQSIAGAVTVHTDDIAWWHRSSAGRTSSRAGCWGRYAEVRPWPSGHPRGMSAAARAPSSYRLTPAWSSSRASGQAGARSRICLTPPCGCSRTSMRSSDEMPPGSPRARAIRRSSRGGCRRSSPLLPTSDHGSAHSWSWPEHQSCRTIRPPKWSSRLRLRAARPPDCGQAGGPGRPDPPSSAEAQASGSSRPRTIAFGTPSSSAGRRPNHHTAYAHALRQRFDRVRMVIG